MQLPEHDKENKDKKDSISQSDETKMTFKHEKGVKNPVDSPSISLAQRLLLIESSFSKLGFAKFS